MKKIQLIIADTDSLYIEAFSEYVLSSNMGNKFDVKFFSNEKSLTQYVSNKSDIDIVLIHENLYAKQLQINESLLVVLQEKKQQRVDQLGVFKYQPLNQIVSNVMSYYYEKNTTLVGDHPDRHKTKVISSYSASGGAGKTTFTVNLARQLALKNHRVFYLNLELIHSTSLYFQSVEDDPSLQIFYYLKAQPEQLLVKIEALKKFDSYSRVYYFDLLPSPDEMLEANKDEVTRLINALVESGEYDYVLIDLDSSVQEATKAAISRSDQIIWLLNNDVQSFHKTKIFLESAKEMFGVSAIEERSLFLVNQFTGHLHEVFMNYDVLIHGYLPYIPDWSDVTDRNQIFFHPRYTQELLVVMERWIEQAGVSIG